MDFLLFPGACVLCVFFFIRWYHGIGAAWTAGRRTLAKSVLICLPLLAFAIILYTLCTMASFDVEGIYVILYLTLGFAWLYMGMLFFTHFFDISWQYDVLLAGNKAALCAVAGAFLGMTLIYAGANVGDGPGWWCVIFAGGLGFTAWAVLGLLFNLFTGVFKRITVDRDFGCGFRFGCYLLAAGIILARASAGDWTSFGATVVEFADGWPVLPMTVIAVLIERFAMYRTKEYLKIKRSYPRTTSCAFSTSASIICGAALLVVAVSAVLLLPPTNVNNSYGRPRDDSPPFRFAFYNADVPAIDSDWRY